MDLRERLRQLTSIKKTSWSLDPENERPLRERLERLLRPMKATPKKELFSIENLVKGEVLSNPWGETFLTQEHFPLHLKYGEMTLSEILSIPTYPAHLLLRDERLKELDFRKALFLDTETTGLSGGTGTFAFMIGLGYFEENGFVIQQLFMRDYSEEKASLSILREILESYQFLVTFNGRLYDIPLLETRFILSRMVSRIREMPNLDLLYPARRIWKGAYENCRLITLESRLLGIERENDVPSEWIPSLYFEYLKTGDARKIYRVFYHNQMDILTMVALAGRIHLIYHNPYAAQPRKGIEHFSLGRLFWDHGEREKAIPCFEIALKQCEDELAWEVMRWLSMAFKKTGQIEKAQAIWEEMLTWPYPKDLFPFVELAKYYEHRCKDAEKAIFYVDQALRLASGNRPREVELLLRRRERLNQKKGENGFR